MNHLKRIPGYSFLQVLACIAIIILHMFASAEILFQNVITPEQITGSNVIVNCMMWAVPCFVMVTGVLLIVVGTAGIIAATVCKGQYNVEQLELLWGYSSILVVCQAAGIFYLMKNVKIQMENKHWKCINFIDQCSFGIYILHMILVRLVLRYWGFNPYEGNIVLNFGGLIIGTLCVTLIVTAVLRKIPGMKKIL